jgi:glycosyltransferase involved in cell wall biosynthesis
LRLRKAVNAGNDKKIILYQGIIELDRGLLNVVRALKKLPADTLFVTVGYGSATGALEQCALELGIRERLLLLPPVPQAELMSYTKDADIGIIPLLGVKSHPYACPGKLFEYIGAELPLVVSDMPNLKLLVEKYGLGEVYPADSVEHLTEAVSRLLRSDSYRKQCAGNARKGQLEDLCWEKQSARLCDIVFKATPALCAPSSA